MVIASDIKTSICSLFKVLEDEGGVQRVVTPIEYSSTGDAVVVRVRPRGDGGFVIDENGEAALNASMAGGDIECDAVQRWLEDQHLVSPVMFDDDVLCVIAQNDLEIAPAIFRVAEAAQQLFTLATSRATPAISRHGLQKFSMRRPSILISHIRRILNCRLQAACMRIFTFLPSGH